MVPFFFPPLRIFGPSSPFFCEMGVAVRAIPFFFYRDFPSPEERKSHSIFPFSPQIGGADIPSPSLLSRRVRREIRFFLRPPLHLRWSRRGRSLRLPLLREEKKAGWAVRISTRRMSIFFLSDLSGVFFPF